MSIKTSRIYIAGHTGLIGSAMHSLLKEKGFTNIITALHSELELANADAVENFFENNQIDYVILAAGRVGGIIENMKYPADFIENNLRIQLNVMNAAHRFKVKKLIFFGSSCMYPKGYIEPMSEDLLFTGAVELTSRPYAISKLAGLQLCLAFNQQYETNRFIPVIPNSVYGPYDNFDPDRSHVLSALITKIRAAKYCNKKTVTLWGSGKPRREFIFSQDIAKACYFLLFESIHEVNEPINIGTGTDISICELAQLISDVIGYHGNIIWDTSKPDGVSRKLLDSSKIHSLGWKPKVNLQEGIHLTVEFLDNQFSKALA